MAGRLTQPSAGARRSRDPLHGIVIGSPNLALILETVRAVGVLINFGFPHLVCFSQLF